MTHDERIATVQVEVPVGDQTSDQRSAAGSDPPASVAVGIALTTDPHTTAGLLEQFCLALADATGLEVVPCGVASYRRLLEQLGAAEVDVVWLPPIPALRATADERVEPLALPVRGGESCYDVALFARTDARFEGLAGLRGLRAAWVDPQSAAGYLIIRAHLEQCGVELSRAFAHEQFVGSHERVAEVVDAGEADVGATYLYRDERGGIKRAGWGARAMRTLVTAGPVPNDLIAARRGLAPELARRVQEALVDSSSEALRDAARALLTADGFVAPTPELLAPLQALLTRMQQAGDQPHSLFPPPANRRV